MGKAMEFPVYLFPKETPSCVCLKALFEHCGDNCKSQIRCLRRRGVCQENAILQSQR